MSGARLKCEHGHWSAWADAKMRGGPPHTRLGATTAAGDPSGRLVGKGCTASPAEVFVRENKDADLEEGEEPWYR